MAPELIDTHAHLDFPEFSSDLSPFLTRAREAGVREIVTIGVSIETSRKAAAIAAENERVFATAGVHPHGAFRLDDAALESLTAVALGERVLAVGEIGLDYYRDRQPRPVQQDCMRQQIELARRIGKPVVFHVREAYPDFLSIAADYGGQIEGAVMHCFSGDWKVARQCLDMGFYLSIPGTVTFPQAERVRDVVRRAPLDRLLVETDAPFLAPWPFRGKVNEPAFVLRTARRIAELRGESFETVAAHTTANARGAFRIPPDGA